MHLDSTSDKLPPKQRILWIDNATESFQRLETVTFGRKTRYDILFYLLSKRYIGQCHLVENEVFSSDKHA
jgi:hypothetical protein